MLITLTVIGKLSVLVLDMVQAMHLCDHLSQIMDPTCNRLVNQSRYKKWSSSDYNLRAGGHNMQCVGQVTSVSHR